ncbi:MAG: VCBS repeat-containing protein, partial [Verrucomicrobiae bacterium]|nr:VCBS repeat-containing protein [Verrucomicrobiae bacterium]
GRVSAVVWADFEKDGFPELVVMPEWGSPRLWRNRQGKLTPNEGAFAAANALSGLWSSLAVGDFNGDGLLDLAGGNIGQNSGGLFRPEEGPHRLWWKAEPLRVRLIETHIAQGEEWPLAWWNHLEESAPGRISRARSYSEYAERNVEELFGDLKSQGYELLEMREFRSGVFWQQADGSFQFQPLPAMAQSGRMVSLLAGDLNGDGISDLVASLELPSMAPWTGRKERGHLLTMLGSKDKNLEVFLPNVSGLDVGAGSPRNLLWGDFDGDGSEELAVGLEEGLPLIFHRSAH